MRRILIFPFSALVGGIALSLTCAAIGGAQESPIKRTVLLETNLTDLGDKEMHVWVGDISPGAATGRHSHPTPRFVYSTGRRRHPGNGWQTAANVQDRSGFCGTCQCGPQFQKCEHNRACQGSGFPICRKRATATGQCTLGDPAKRGAKCFGVGASLRYAWISG